MTKHNKSKQKSMQDQRKEIAVETVQVLKAGRYLTESANTVCIRQELRAAVEGSRLYRPADLVRLTSNTGTQGRQTQFEVHNETTLEGARALLLERSTRGEGSVSRVCVLNFASARRPGGGFLWGARAQEEDLARASGLHACLVRKGISDYYQETDTSNDGMYANNLIHSPDVPVFREDNERGRFLEEPYLVSMITAAAPNAREMPEADLPAEYWAAFQEKIRSVLMVALDNRHTNLVLGAWGCGVFGNSPVRVARLFEAELQSPAIADRFERIRFSVMANRDDDPNLVAFRHVFTGNDGNEDNDET